MGEELGNIYDLKHDCRRHGLTEVSNRYNKVGDVERCDCGRLWVFRQLAFGRGWKPLRGLAKRRWEATQMGRNGGPDGS